MKSFTTTAITTVIISIMTLMGIVLHDTKLDKLARTFIGVPSIAAATEGLSHSVKTDDHTHVERFSFREMKSQDQPKRMPRYLEQKKHMMQRGAPKGSQFFDGTCVPI